MLLTPTETPGKDEAIRLPLVDGKGVPARRFYLTREGRLWLLASLVMFITGLFKGINLLVLLAYLLFGLWLVNWWMVRRDLRGISARRHYDGPIFAGTPFSSSIKISGTLSGFSRGITIEDRGRDHQQSYMILRLARGEQERIRCTHCIERRGRYGIQPLRAASSFPFGLVSRSLEIGPAEEWIILPRLGLLNAEQFKQWLARSTRGDGRTRRQRLHPTFQEAEIHGLRDYRVGDSPRWIHWRSSARRNQILVREFEESSPPGLILVVEPWLPESPTAHDKIRLEKLIGLAATLCWESCREPSARLSLIVSRAEGPILPPGTGHLQAHHALEILAVEEGQSTVPAADWFARVCRMSATAPVLVLTSNPASTLADEAEALLGRSVARALADDVLPWYEGPVQPVKSS
ncbi:MAG: DUF58 domain-containing protein [Planctomycetes bacterium]|nr:DUF58 domain-containing protein [Planctomycetota bacterium]